MNFSIIGIGTAVPPMYITQAELLEHFRNNFILKPEEEDLYRRLLTNGLIRGRHVGIGQRSELVSTDPEELIARFQKYGVSTAVEAARKAMADAKVKPKDIKGLVVNTCTGYLCPGLSSYISQELRLSRNISIMDIMGMGCGSAIPNLECACGMISRSGTGPVLSIAVEICSATFFPSHEPELIVSNCIFGDGAAAAVIDSTGKRNGYARILDFASGNYPEYREELRYRNKKGLLRNYLSRRVPVIGAKTGSEVVSKLLARNKISKNDIAWWAVHPGGSQVLAQIGKKMKLDRKDLAFSYDVFENFGNMSSPSVLFVLEKILEDGRPESGQKGILLSFGAGFTAFAALLEF
ncbi:MAG TPA: 3-oxoacyl-ACP synthase [Lentisphaeria bacterium]|nr:MAG: 3-oxoacyl-ACP synthase [Lentisphaerae bacterium GWF2_50_93]HCE46987.1 3-oxoacyl-ACP synthase [Lentisphaeria bacterium]